MKSSDPANCLRSLFSAGTDVAGTFTSMVDYVAARPSYPTQVFAFFSGTVGVKIGALVVDIGAGSSLFTAGLLAGLQSLAFSRSYMPDCNSDRASAVAQAVTGIFRRFAEGPTVMVRYTTLAFVGRPA